MREPKCLHCRLMDAVDGWISDLKAEGEEVGRDAVLFHVARFIEDMIVATSEPGQDRMDANNALMMELMKGLVPRITEGADDDDEPGIIDVNIGGFPKPKATKH